MLKKWQRYIVVLPAMFILAYTVFRAWKLSITIDEGTSFIYYALDSYKHILAYTRLEANNHALNSVLMKFFSSWLPLSELTIRLPSLIAQVLYMAFTWLLFRDVKNVWYRLGIWLLLNLNPYMLDFFSLARGYAQSWALMVGSLYFLRRFIEKEEKKMASIVWCYVLAALGVMASFSLLYYYLMLLAVSGLYGSYILIYTRASRRPGWFRKAVVFIIVISMAILSYSVHILLQLEKAHYLYFGGVIGFWQDTMETLADTSLYGAWYVLRYNKLIIQMVPILVATNGLYLFYMLAIARKPIKKYGFLLVITVLLLGAVALMLLRFYGSGTRLLIGRSAFYLLVLYLIMAAEFFYQYFNRTVLVFVACCLGTVAIWHFAETANLSTTDEWRQDADTRQMMQDLNKYHLAHPSPNPGQQILHPYNFFATSAMFYQYLYHDSWLENIEYTEELNHAEDYYYLPHDGLSLLDGYKYQIIGFYPRANAYLIKNLEKKKQVIYCDRSVNIPDTVIENSALLKFLPIANEKGHTCARIDPNNFSPAINCDAAKMPGNGEITVRAWATIYCPSGKCGELDIDLQDSSGKTLKWDGIHFEDYLFQKKGWMTVPLKVIYDPINLKAAQIKISVWNTGDRAIYMTDLKTKITGF